MADVVVPQVDQNPDRHQPTWWWEGSTRFCEMPVYSDMPHFHRIGTIIVKDYTSKLMRHITIALDVPEDRHAVQK